MELIHCPGGGGAGLRPKNGPNDPKMMLPRCTQTPGAPLGLLGGLLQYHGFMPNYLPTNFWKRAEFNNTTQHSGVITMKAGREKEAKKLERNMYSLRGKQIEKQ